MIRLARSILTMCMASLLSSITYYNDIQCKQWIVHVHGTSITLIYTCTYLPLTDVAPAEVFPFFDFLNPFCTTADWCSVAGYEHYLLDSLYTSGQVNDLGCCFPRPLLWRAHVVKHTVPVVHNLIVTLILHWHDIDAYKQLAFRATLDYIYRQLSSTVWSADRGEGNYMCVWLRLDCLVWGMLHKLADPKFISSLWF